MNIKIFMIKVKYDHSKKVDNGRLPIKYIHVGQEIKNKDQNFWTIPTHFREKRNDSIRQIGIRITNSSSEQSIAISSPDSKKIENLSYNHLHNIWYQEQFFSTKKNKYNQFSFDEKVLAAGVASTGTILIISTASSLSVPNLLGKIDFIPSSLSIEDYDVMLTELFMISEDLIREEKNIATASIDSFYQISNFEKQISKLSTALNHINYNPHKELKSTSVSKKHYNNGQFDISFEMQKYLYPGKSSYQVKKLNPAVNTTENQMIKQILIKLNNYFSIRTKHPLFNKHFINRLNVEKESLLISASTSIDFQTNNSISLLENEQLNSKVKELKQLITEIEENEEKHRTHILTSDKSSENLKEESICLNFLLKGELLPTHKFKHTIDSEKLNFQVTYDHYSHEAKSIFEFLSYSLDSSKDMKPQSKFGKLKMHSLNISHHIKLHNLFFKAYRQKGVPLHVKIVGKVKPVPFPNIDAVSSLHHSNNKYPTYLFDLTDISFIIVNGENYQVDDSEETLKQFVQHTLPYEHPTDQLEKYERYLILLKQLEKILDIDKKVDQHYNSFSKFRILADQTSKLLELPVMKQVSLQFDLPIRPTTIFLHNPSYRLAWQAIHKIQKEQYISLDYIQNKEQIGTIKSHELYEVWALFKMIQILTIEMNWTLQNSHTIHQYLQSYLKTNGSLNKFYVVLIMDFWELELHYEPHLRQNVMYSQVKSNHLTPDFVFKFSYKGISIGMSIIDTKYRNYSVQGINAWKKDIEDTAINKYGKMVPIDQSWNLRILSSSIMHSTEDSSFSDNELCHPYHVLYNSQLFKIPYSLNNAHRYSSLVMTPSNYLHFKNWFRMQLEFHLDSYQTCWNCGESHNVCVKKLATRSGLAKFHYTCQTCNEFWVKVHCNQHGHKLIKHLSNYHLQERKGPSSNWYVRCPSCENDFDNIE